MSWKPQGFKNGETYCVAPIVLGKAQIGVGRKELWLIALRLMSIGGRYFATCSPEVILRKFNHE